MLAGGAEGGLGGWTAARPVADPRRAGDVRPDRVGAGGGLGLAEPDAVGVLEETGRAAVPGPVAESFAVAHALRAGGHDEPLAALADGALVVSLGLGTDPLVESADRAGLLVLEHDGALHAVPGASVRTERQDSVDGARRLFTVAWEPAAATELVGGADLVAQTRDRLLLAVSAQLVGLSRQLLELAVAHVRVREQFGRPLGSFQAVQHRLADVAVAVEFAGPVVARAACSLAAGAPSGTRDVAMAKVFASEAAERAAYSALQVHGAMGYTREHDLHLYGLRAWALALAHGDAAVHRERVAAELFGGPAPRYP